MPHAPVRPDSGSNAPGYPPLLQAARGEYYRLLGEVRKSGDWEAWTDYFLEGVATIADEAVATARDVFALVNGDRQRVLAASGASVIAARLLEQLPIHPVVTIPGIVKLLETTKPTAGRGVQLLERVGDER